MLYSYIEGWSFGNAMWWSDFTILTIGVGYPAPTTHLRRGLLFPYAFGGILITGIIVLERGKNKMKMRSRLLERTRSTFTKLISKLEDTGNAVTSGMLGLIPIVDHNKELEEEERAK